MHIQSCTHAYIYSGISLDEQLLASTKSHEKWNKSKRADSAAKQRLEDHSDSVRPPRLQYPTVWFLSP